MFLDGRVRVEGGKYCELRLKRDIEVIEVEEIAAIERVEMGRERDAEDKFVWGRIVTSSAIEV